MRDLFLLVFSFLALLFGGFIFLEGTTTGTVESAATVEQARSESPVAGSPTPLPTPQPTPTPEPEPQPSTAPVARIRIEKIGIDVGLIVLGVDPDGTMQAPKQPMEVGWYDFSAHPGYPGNAVFAGHVDFARFGPAVFYRLRELGAGDRVQVSLQDGTAYEYSVVSSRRYSANEAPVEEIIGPTAAESITLITCDGVFNARTREYDSRLVVRAERVRG